MSRLILSVLAATLLLAACGDAGASVPAAPGATGDTTDTASATSEPSEGDHGDAKPSITIPPTPPSGPATTPSTPAPPVAAPATPTDLSAAVPMPSTLPPYTIFNRITDHTGRITLEVPAEWTDVDGSPLEVNGVTVSDIRASSDLVALATTWTTPGVIVSAGDLPGVTPESVLDEERASLDGPCAFAGREPYGDPLYTGVFDTYDACGGTEAAYVVIAARAHDGTGPLIEVQVQVSDARDVQALEQIVASFVVA